MGAKTGRDSRPLMSLPELFGYVLGGAAGFFLGYEASGWYDVEWLGGLVLGSLSGAFGMSAVVVVVRDQREPLSRFQDKFTPRTRWRAAVMLVGAAAFAIVYNRGDDAPPKFWAVIGGIILSRAALLLYENWWVEIRDQKRSHP